MAEQQAGSNSMNFYDNYKTPLEAGLYRFVLQQTVTLEGKDQRHYYQDQPFEVVAPRYSIEADEIQAYFPPPGGVADYQRNLPHLVMRARNLPWERKPWPDAAREPWLALLVLSEEDIARGQPVAKMGALADLKPDIPAATLWSRKEGNSIILLPNFLRDQDQETAVRLLDLDVSVFLSVCPRAAEWPLLAHIRRVDMTGKTPLEGVADGEFAVLVGNRFPQPGANTIYMISLEGWHGLIEGRGQQPPASRVRLITLASWSFVSDPAGHDTFGGLMQRLGKNSARFGARSAVPSRDGHVNEALARGYVPLDYRPLDSTATFAWYRGPLSPLARASLGRPPFRRADAALIFDDRTGIMDVSYAAAWQLGRLLALSSPTFVKGLRLFVERAENASELPTEIKKFLDQHSSTFSDLASLTPQPEEVRITDDLVQWIARLVLLYPVPFHYLVPHPSLLPPESLRFFHVDDNWLDALLDGALSIAARKFADKEKEKASRAELQTALSRIVYQYRLRLLGKEAKSVSSERYMEVPKSGFLLRSTIVSDWPGVEVTVTTSGRQSSASERILRLDQISDGVLFCLASGSIEQVIFREPLEGLTFGVDSAGGIKAHKSGRILNVKEDLLRATAGAGVTDIAALRTRLEQAEGPGIGPAALALQMVRMPEEQVIQWG